MPSNSEAGIMGHDDTRICNLGLFQWSGLSVSPGDPPRPPSRAGRLVGVPELPLLDFVPSQAGGFCFSLHLFPWGATACDWLSPALPCCGTFWNQTEETDRTFRNCLEPSRRGWNWLELAGTSLGQPRPLLPDTSAACAAGSLPHAPNATTYCSYVIFN